MFETDVAFSITVIAVTVNRFTIVLVAQLNGKTQMQKAWFCCKSLFEKMLTIKLVLPITTVNKLEV